MRSGLGGVTTVYPNDLVEWSGTTLTKYYYANGQRIAMRKGSTLTYLLSDYLGSAAVALDTNGTIVSEQHYRAYGVLSPNAKLSMS